MAPKATKATKRTPEPNPKIEWEVVTETRIGPQLKKVGDTVLMTRDAAKYYVPHILKEKAPDSGAKPAAKPSAPSKGAQG